jgi:carbamoyl-phosphate synthase small subunit
MSAADSRPAARLVLEDGTVFTGRAFGACRMPLTSAGELVFNTAMTGYQEALTDPSYAGQILTMTAPLIGNYGVGPEDVESGRPQVSGFVVRELARRHSNFRADRSVDEWLLEAGVLGIERIDTRALVRTVRIHGAMRSVLTCDPDPRDDDLVDTARAAAGMAGRNLAREVSPDAAFEWQDDLGPWTGPGTPAPGERPLDVIALDCGAKRNIYRHLVSRGCRVRALPHDVSAEEILAPGADGLLVSNGPGDPAAVESTVRTLRAVIGKLPIMGICLGHQLLALALGAGTYKLKFGHRGGNQPVRNLDGQRRDHEPEPRVLRRRRAPRAARLRDHPPAPQRRHPRGVPAPGAAAVQRAVPPRGVARTARLGVPLRLLRGDDPRRRADHRRADGRGPGRGPPLAGRTGLGVKSPSVLRRVSARSSLRMNPRGNQKARRAAAPTGAW